MVAIVALVALGQTSSPRVADEYAIRPMVSVANGLTNPPQSQRIIRVNVSGEDLADHASRDAWTLLFYVIGLGVALWAIVRLHRAQSPIQERRAILLLAVGLSLLFGAILQIFPIP